MNAVTKKSTSYPFLKSLLQSHNLAVMQLDATLEIVDYSPGLKNLFKIESDNDQLKELLQICRYKVNNTDPKQMQGVPECTSRKKIQLIDGTLLFLKIKLIGLMDNGNFQGAAVFLEDETEQSNRIGSLEMKFNEQIELMNKLYFESPVGVLIIESSSAHILHANPTFCKMLGYEEEELKSLNAYGITHPDDKKAHIEKYLNTIKNEKDNFLFTKHYLKKDGTSVSAKISASIIKDEYGKPLFDVVTILEMTDAEEAQKILEDQEKQLTTKNKEIEKYIDSNNQLQNFAFIASHDLKAPLRMIGSFTQLLNHNLKQHFGEKENEYMNFVLNGVRDMSHLIDDLLAYSKIQKKPHDFEIFDLHKVREIVIRNLSEIIEEKYASVCIQEIPQMIRGNKTQILQLFQNLIANGLKFQETGNLPKVKVKSRDLGTHWEFAFTDNGIGIVEEHYDKIFQLFQRLNGKSDYEGSGIGLAYCKRVVELHGGRIWVNSNSGEGTTFYFTLQK